MSFSAYSGYQESSVQWLGQVPSHWEVAPLKRLIDIQNGADYRDVERDDGYPVFGSGGPFTYASTYLFDGEAILLGRKGTIDRPLHVHGRFWTVDTMYWSKVRSGINGRFAYYTAMNIPFGYYSTNTALPSMTQSALNGHPVALPPLGEQNAIAAFLDRETSKIDVLVDEQRRLIALLKEKRQAVISHGVTKGMNPGVPMKESGSAWLGEVPAHWSIAPLMRLTEPGRDIMYGIVLPGPDVGEGGVPIVKGGDVKPHRLRVDLLNRTTHEIELPFARARLRPLDIVYSIRGSIGDAEEVPPELLDANITQDVARISPRHDLNARWLLYVMRSKPIFVQLEQRSLGAAVRGINIYDLKRASVPVPPADEQLAISTFLDRECQRFDDLTAVASRGIALLQERRAALISAAVTGKIDVRDSAKAPVSPVDRVRARGLVAVEIIERSSARAFTGRTKLQKIAYLADTHVGVSELEGSYLREAAGPLDREMIQDMEREAGKLAGVQVDQPEGPGTLVSYRLAGQRGTRRTELTALLGADRSTKLDKLIDDIATIDTKGAEAVATLYAVWNDALIEGETPTDTENVLAVLTEWHPEKMEKFRMDELHTWLGWMRRHGLVPRGDGPKTSTGRLFA